MACIIVGAISGVSEEVLEAVAGALQPKLLASWAATHLPVREATEHTH